MAQPPKVYVHDRVYFPVALVDKHELKDKYTIPLYKDASCARCEYLADRHTLACDTCQNFEGWAKLYKLRNIGDRPYIGLPIGDKAKMEKITGVSFDEVRIIDKRNRTPFDYKIRFTLTPREYQEKIHTQFMAEQYGMISAPPRTGKTAMSLRIMVELGNKALWLASQQEFLDQFLDHIYGNEEEGIPCCTNIPKLEAKYGVKLAGTPKCAADLEHMQIIAMTYQSFLRNIKWFRRIKKWTSTLGLDEVHAAAAPEFSRIVNEFSASVKFGVSGTIERKDKRHRLLYKILGPVVAKTAIEMALPKVTLHETGAVPKSDYKMWHHAISFLANHKKRNDLIAKMAVKDAKCGYGVVIPVYFKKHVLDLIGRINKLAGKKIAEPFVGGGSKKNKADRKAILQRAKSGQTLVIVGIRGLLQKGLNVPRWYSILEVMPISNEPNLRQETSRVRTPMDGKPQPVVRMMVDSRHKISMACVRNSLLHMQGFGYEFEDKKEFNRIINSGKKGYVEDDEYKPRRMIEADDGRPKTGFLSKLGKKK